MTTEPVKNILVFDDDRDYRALLKTYLQKYIEDARVEEYDPVACGVPGEEFNWADYDVVILDYYLCIYGVTGLDLLHKNRNKPGFPAVIMLTGAADQDIAVSALDSGVSAFLRKEKLDKMELVEAIRSAASRHEEKRREQDHLEKASRSFDKAGFYRRLAKTGSKGEPDHVFLYLDIDDYALHVDQHGVIVSTNLLRHIAKLAFRFFQERRNITNITRISDSSLGLLIDHPGTMVELESIMQELCEYLGKHEFTYQDSNIRYSVSIGIQVLRQDMGDHGEIVGQLKQARNIARKTSGNSYCIYGGEDDDLLDSDITDLGAVSPGNHDLRISEEQLDSNSRQIMKAFREGRAVKWFHPVVATSAKQEVSSQVIMKMEVGFVDEEGNTVEPDQLRETVNSGPVRQYIDRWKLKELLARITGNEKSDTGIVYMLEVGESWFADMSLFKWLRGLLGKLEPMQPGRNLVLLLEQDMLEKNKTRAVALLTALGKTHRFRFALGGINPARFAGGQDMQGRFEFGVVAADDLLENPAFSENPALLLKSVRALRDHGMQIIVAGIENSTMLTDAISFGADYVMGPFIDESQSEFRTMERIEAL